MAIVTTYVNTASAGGNGTENVETGPTAAYPSLNAWDAAEATDLVTDGDVHIVYVSTGSGTTADMTPTTIRNWITGSANYIQIEAASGEEAVATGWDTNRYRLSVGAYQPFIINENYVRIMGLQVETAQGYGADNVTFYVAYTGTGEVRIDSCYIRGLNAGANPKALVIGGGTVNIYNNVIIGSGIGIEGRNVVGPLALAIYNNTVYDHATYGLNQVNGSMVAKNNAIFVTGNDFNGATITIDYNASDDNDGTNNVAESGGGANWPSDFTDAANGDFTLVSGSGLIGAGTADPGSGLFSDDIAGTARGATWDVGAFEFVAAGGSTIPVFMKSYRDRMMGALI